MAKDFIPNKDGSLKAWLVNFKKSVSETGSSLGLSADDISRAEELCKEFADQIVAASAARNKAKSEVEKKNKMRKTHLQPLRKIIKRMKNAPAYTTGTGAGMSVLVHKQVLDKVEYQPVLKARMTGQMIEVKFKKRGIDGIEFWGQINDGEWKFLATRMHSPFYYKPEGYPQGTALNCKIKGIAIKDDEQIGKWSGVTTVLYVTD